MGMYKTRKAYFESLYIFIIFPSPKVKAQVGAISSALWDEVLLIKVLLLRSIRVHNSMACPPNGEGNGTPLQYSCLENPTDGGAWWAAVHGVAKSRTRLKRFSSISSSPPNSIFKATTDISKPFLLRFFYGLVSKIRSIGINLVKGFKAGMS